MFKNARIILLGLMIISFGCNPTDEFKQDLKPLNSFSMTLNDQLWQPSLIENDSCYSTFRCDLSEIDDSPFYTIQAFRDSQSRSNFESENIFRFQIMNVTGTGDYNISDPYGDLNSYAYFIINELGNQRIYENHSTQLKAVVSINEIYPIAGSMLTGIKGTFTGVLYNKDNPNDSIVIDNCNFTFKKINWANFNQCAEF